MLPDDPLTALKELEEGLRAADKWFRDTNRNTILDFLDEIITAEQQGNRTSADNSNVLLAYILEVIAPIVSVDEDYLESVTKRREAVVAQPATDRRRILSASRWILDRLDHRERLGYLPGAVLNGMIPNNNYWSEVILTRKKPKYIMMEPP